MTMPAAKSSPILLVLMPTAADRAVRVISRIASTFTENYSACTSRARVGAGGTVDESKVIAFQ